MGLTVNEKAISSPSHRAILFLDQMIFRDREVAPTGLLQTR